MPKKHSFLMELLLFPLKILLFILQVVLFAGFIIAGWFFLQTTGIFPVQVPVSGASMLPTLPEDGYVEFQRYVSDPRLTSVIHQNIKRGDIVVFENEQTAEELKKQEKDETGFVKRVIGIAGDTVTIRDGYVLVNNKPVEEPYTLKPRSTFGGTEVQDCQAVTVPEGKLMVLGDNRKVSLDSRQIGFVSIDDIKYYIPYDKQSERFASVWRDSTHDLDAQNESLFNVDEYIDLLNVEREKHGLQPLVYQPKLERTAQLRSAVMLKYDDFDFDSPKSNYTMEDAMNDVGYFNVVYGEFPMIGYYDAQELFDAFFEYQSSSEFLLNEDYEEIGVSTLVGDLNGCPVQVVVQHLAGYVPPNYGTGEIASWEQGLQKLKQVQPGWEKLKTYNEFYADYRNEVDRINEIIALRISRMEQIIERMKANEWFTDEEKAWIDEDSKLAGEQNSLADTINNAQ